MTEHGRQTPDPKELHWIKGELVSLWEQLPSAHQATMALVLIDRVMQGEWGVWLKEAIAIKWKDEDDEDGALTEIEDMGDLADLLGDDE